MKSNIEILIDNEELDLGDADIVLDFVLFNAESPESAGYTRSYTISIPATPKNNRLLSNMNAISVISAPANYSVPCVIRIEGVQIAAGSSLLVSRTTQQKYDCNILLGKSQLADALADKTLQDLDLGQVTYQYSNMNLTDTSLDYINAVFKTQQYATRTWYNLLYSWKVRALFEKIFAEAGYSITGGYPTEMDWTQETYVPSSSEKFDFEEEFENYAQANYTGSLVRTTPLTIPPVSTIIVTFDTITGNPAYFKTDRFEPLTKVPYRLRLKVKCESGPVYVRMIVSTNNSNPIPTSTALHSFIILNASSNQNEADFQIPFCGGTNILGNVFVEATNYNPFPVALSEVSLEVTPLFFPLEGLFQYNFAKNLPAVSQREFVKNVLFLSGCVFDTDLFDASVTIRSINSVLNEPAKDWTDKIDFRSEVTQEFMMQLAKKTNIQFKNTKDGAIFFETNNAFAKQEKNISIQANRAENEYVVLNYNVVVCLSTNYYEFPSSNLVAHPKKTSSENDNISAPFLCNPKRKGGELLFAKLDIPATTTVIREPNQNNPNRIIEGSFVGNEISTFNSYTLPASSRRLVGIDDLSEFEPNFSYSQKLYEKYRKVVLSAYLDITDLLNLRSSTIFVGGDINRKFLLTAVRAWSGSNKPCKIELLLIDET